MGRRATEPDFLAQVDEHVRENANGRVWFGDLIRGTQYRTYFPARQGFPAQNGRPGPAWGVFLVGGGGGVSSLQFALYGGNLKRRRSLWHSVGLDVAGFVRQLEVQLRVHGLLRCSVTPPSQDPMQIVVQGTRGSTAREVAQAVLAIGSVVNALRNALNTRGPTTPETPPEPPRTPTGPIGPRTGSPQVEGYIVRSREDVRLCTRNEAQLVERFLASLGRQLQLSPLQIRSFEADLYSKTNRELIEAKASVTREDIRMAIGQLFDYRRLLDGTKYEGPTLAVLLPERPPADLEDLLSSLGIGGWYESPPGSGKFEWWDA